jgi:hypothetical protein
MEKMNDEAEVALEPEDMVILNDAVLAAVGGGIVDVIFV